MHHCATTLSRVLVFAIIATAANAQIPASNTDENTTIPETGSARAAKSAEPIDGTIPSAPSLRLTLANLREQSGVITEARALILRVSSAPKVVADSLAWKERANFECAITEPGDYRVQVFVDIAGFDPVCARPAAELAAKEPAASTRFTAGAQTHNLSLRVAVPKFRIQQYRIENSAGELVRGAGAVLWPRGIREFRDVESLPVLRPGASRARDAMPELATAFPMLKTKDGVVFVALRGDDDLAASIYVQHPRYLGSLLELSDRSPLLEQEFVHRLLAHNETSLRVRGADGQPLRNAKVFVVSRENVSESITNDRGIARILDAAQSERAQAYVFPHEAELLPWVSPVKINDLDPGLIEVAAQAPCTIRGRATGDAGAPLAGADMALYGSILGAIPRADTYNNHSAFRVGSCGADADGNYEFRGVQPGRYWIGPAGAREGDSASRTKLTFVDASASAGAALTQDYETQESRRARSITGSDPSVVAHASENQSNGQRNNSLRVEVRVAEPRNALLRGDDRAGEFLVTATIAGQSFSARTRDGIAELAGLPSGDARIQARSECGYFGFGAANIAAAETNVQNNIVLEAELGGILVIDYDGHQASAAEFERKGERIGSIARLLSNKDNETALPSGECVAKVSIGSGDVRSIPVTIPRGGVQRIQVVGD